MYVHINFETRTNLQLSAKIIFLNKHPLGNRSARFQLRNLLTFRK